MTVIYSKSKKIEFDKRSLIMGILNVTPDSFSDGGEHNSIESALKHAQKMLVEGADIIDIGGESTRPNHTKVSLDEELKRVLPVVKAVSKIGATVSIDTTKAIVADKAIESGAHIINDVWGFQGDKAMAEVAAKHQVMSVLMHNRTEVDADIDIVEDCKHFFERSIAIALAAGLKRELIVLDIGIGFAKTPLQNVELLKRLDKFKEFNCPLLLGTSRKSTLGKILDLPVNERLEGTLATTALGVAKGVDIFRVHDVKENARLLKVADAIERGWQGWIE